MEDYFLTKNNESKKHFVGDINIAVSLKLEINAKN